MKRLKALKPDATSRTRVWAWTILGPGLCAILANLYVVWTIHDPAVARAAHWSSTILPFVFGAPLFYILSSRLRDLAIIRKQLAVLAATDALTGTLSRGAFTDKVDAWLEKRRRHLSAYRRGALLIVDADHFKRINDSHGHHWGDEALRLIASTIARNLRSADLFGRMGGEEFGIFLPDATLGDAEVIAERIRRAVAEIAFTPEGKVLGLTVSVGGAVFEEEIEFSELYRIADSRLYAAKEGGRNTIRLTPAERARPVPVVDRAAATAPTIH